MEEFKHVCRICKKRFPSGKSLGGHMRSHVIAEARKNKLLNLQNHNNKVSNFIVNNHVNDDVVDDDDEEDDDDVDVDVDEEDDDHEINRNSGYGLRENPKKTWRIVNSNYKYNISNNNNNQEKLRVCDQCGKGFNSMKALCGHMSIHSSSNNNNNINNMSTDFRSTYFTHQRSNNNNNNNSNKNEDDEDDNSWCSDSIDQLYLAMDSHSSDNNINNSKRLTRSSVNVNGGGSSSNHSEIDQLEQEEVAMCLMMLSRDSSGSNYKNNNGFEFRVSESSDNNSVILEGGLKVGRRMMIKGKTKTPEMVNSDSGYFEFGAKELESDASVDGFVKTKRKIQDLVESNQNYSSKKIRNDSFYSSNNTNTDTNTNTNTRKYECWICSKSFKTHQALGGHIISHRKTSETVFETSDNQARKYNNGGTIKKGNASKKVKGHKCPYCPKVFKSGQALGGHKRSHMMGSSNNNNNNNNNVVLHSRVSRVSRVPVQEPEPELKQPLIDLNLPAPLEEEGSGNSQFMMSW